MSLNRFSLGLSVYNSTVQKPSAGVYMLWLKIKADCWKINWIQIVFPVTIRKMKEFADGKEKRIIIRAMRISEYRNASNIKKNIENLYMARNSWKVPCSSWFMLYQVETSNLDNKTIEKIAFIIIYIPICGGWNNGLQTHLVLIAGTYEYVGLHGKAELKLQMELRLLTSCL